MFGSLNRNGSCSLRIGSRFGRRPTLAAPRGQSATSARAEHPVLSGLAAKKQTAKKSTGTKTTTPKTKARKSSADAKTTARKKTAAKKAKSASKLSALKAAARVLSESGQPMTCREMIEAMAAGSYWTSPAGKTPANTLYSAILRQIDTKGKESRFRKVDRGQFALTKSGR